VVSWNKKLYAHCVELVGSRNGLQCDLQSHNCFFYNRAKLTNTIKLNYNETIKRRLCYKNDDFVELAYEEKWYIGKIEDVDMTDQEV